MNFHSGQAKNLQQLAEIAKYAEKSSGLKVSASTETSVRVHQSVDGKSIEIRADAIEDLLFRSDYDGAAFIQVNLCGGKKVLLTDALIGFKPLAPSGLDASRLPRVVTTPDVINVFEAIQDVLHAPGHEAHEVAILKKVFDAVLLGGEAVGFDLGVERSWMARIPTTIPVSNS